MMWWGLSVISKKKKYEPKCKYMECQVGVYCLQNFNETGGTFWNSRNVGEVLGANGKWKDNLVILKKRVADEPI